MGDGLEFRGVTVRAGGRALLDNISLTLAPGELAVLVGPNGAGKTTLIRAALGLSKPSAGDVLVGGHRIDGMTGRERASRVAWVPQMPTQREALTVVEHTAAARYRFDESYRKSREAARAALERFGAGALAEAPMTGLSGGESQRVSFAVMMAQEAPLLLLDEPANHLDPAQQIKLYQQIGELWSTGFSVLCITHDVNLLGHVACRTERPIRVIGLREGRMRFDSTFGATDLPAQLGELFDIEVRELSCAGRRVLVPCERPASS